MSKTFWTAIARVGTAILARVRPDLRDVANAGGKVIDEVEADKPKKQETAK